MNERPLWADLHNHNALGYGQGSLDRSYEIAKGSLLDAYCFTPHGLWHDRPATDPKMKAFHEQGFERVRESWHKIVEKANAENTDGTFTAFIGFEWHSSEFGDFHVIVPGDEGELPAPNTAGELRDFCRTHGALMIPHHVGYRRGWRGANWGEVDAELSPVVEVFSEHGCGMEPESHWPMLAHSMGGSERSQTFLAELTRGRVAGLVASTDNHFGHPASYAEGLTGIWAEGHDRAAVFDAIRNHHTVALTGDRIRLAVEMGGGMMGDVLPADAPRDLHAELDALGAVDYVEIWKNGTVALHESPCSADADHCTPLGPPPGSPDDAHVARIEFGWDAMTSEAVTDWRIRTRVRGGQIQEAAPCFAGGAGSVEKLNRVLSVSPEEVAFESFTSRRNPRPTSAVVLRVLGAADTRLEVIVEAEHEGERCACDFSASMVELLERDKWCGISGAFSGPKVRLGGVHHHSQTRFALDWTDPEPGASDWYLVTVQQKNGHVAWSSPIWCR
ncbi:MAG: DUF3604 domain-containing protein [Planctomycetota bacterium]